MRSTCRAQLLSRVMLTAARTSRADQHKAHHVLLVTTCCGDHVVLTTRCVAGDRGERTRSRAGAQQGGETGEEARRAAQGPHRCEYGSLRCVRACVCVCVCHGAQQASVCVLVRVVG